MRFFNLNVQRSETYAKLISWGRILSVTGFKQATLQALGLICGILVIRTLSVKEYALYTVANTMLGTMTILADGGIAAGVMSEGGKVWQRPESLGKTLATGLVLRKRFAIGSLIVGLPILVYLLVHHGASYLMISLVVISIVPSFFAALSDSLLEVAPKLHQDLNTLQRNQIFVAVLRLFLTLPLFIFPMTFIAILASGMSRIYGNIKLRKITGKFITREKPDKIIEKEIIQVVRRILPGSIYYCISSQLTIFLMSFFGNTTSIGQIGALSRLSAALAVLSMMFNLIIVPRFARLSADYHLLKRRYLQIVVVNGVVLTLIVVVVHLFSEPLLMVLGHEYRNLNLELLLTVMAGCAALFSGFNFALSTSRGWVIKPIIEIGIHLSAVVIGIFLFNFSQLRNALYYNLFLESSSIVVGTIFCFYKINQLKAPK